MEIDPVVIIGTIIVLASGAMLGYFFSPKRGGKYSIARGFALNSFLS